MRKMIYPYTIAVKLNFFALFWMKFQRQNQQLRHSITKGIYL